MSVTYTLTSKTRVDSFKDSASIQDVVKYVFDCTPWQEDNTEILAVTWTVESGNASIANQQNASGVISADVTLNQATKVLISILISAANVKKKIWLEIKVKDLQNCPDDYGITA